MNEATAQHDKKKRLENPPRIVNFRISRREDRDAKQYTETFEVPYRRNLNVISALMDIRKNPVTKDGKQTTPPELCRYRVDVAVLRRRRLDKASERIVRQQRRLVQPVLEPKDMLAEQLGVTAFPIRDDRVHLRSSE